MKLDEKLIAKYMKSLGISRDEAIELMMEDEEVDHMTSVKQIDADLTDEQRKAKKSATKTTSEKKKTTVYKFETRGKKKDAEKEEIVQKIFDLVSKITKNCQIVNANREISFDFGENNYSLTLTKHRAPKN